MVKLAFDPATLDSNGKAIYEALIAKRKSQGAPFDGPYAALMNHPELCEKIEALGYYLKFKGHLTRDVYQFVVLCVAKETKSDFEWEDHVPHAIEAGVQQVVLNMLQNQGLVKSTFPAPYHLAASVLEYTLVWENIPENVQSAAIEAYGIKGFLEIVVLSGFYQLFSAINQGFDIQHS